MKQPSRNKALLSQLKKAREHVPPESAQPTTAAAAAENATESAAPPPISASAASPTASPAPASSSGSVIDVAPTPPAGETASTDDATRASQAFGVVPPPAATVSTESATAVSDWPPTLARHAGPGRWTQRNLLAALAADLPPDFPAICYGSEEICPRGIYRSVQRSRGGSAVRLSGPSGTREFTPVRTSGAYRGWLQHFTRHRSPDPQHDAVRLCCAELVSHLESFEDHQRERWTKTIDPTAWAPLEAAPEAR